MINRSYYRLLYVWREGKQLMFSIKKEFNTPIGRISSSISLEKGELGLLSGENGVGKTTFFNVLKAFKNPDWSFCDQGNLDALEHYRPRDIVQIIEQVKDPRQKSFRARKVMEFLEMAKMGEIYSKPLAILSGGQEQVFKLALCFSFDCLVYFLDEPLVYLDQHKQALLEQTFKDLKQQGKMILSVDHLPSYQGMIDRIFEMKKEKGQIIIEEKF